MASSSKSNYASLLKAFFESPQEQYLAKAAELGREMVRSGDPPEEIAEIHEEAINRLTEEFPDVPLLESTQRISAPLMEMLMAYGLAFREREEERRRAEAERKRLEDNLRHAQKMESVGQLAAGLAHEFNNMLVVILGNAEYLLASDIPQCLKQPLRDIEKAGTRAADLTQQLLSFARKRSSKPAIFDVNQTIAQNMNALLRAVDEGILLKTELTSNELLVRADEAELDRAITNLVMNSRDAMSSGGTITLRTESLTLEAGELDSDCKAGPYVRLAAIDDGCGMSPEVSQRIFEPFFTTKPVGKGTGLGLSTLFADITASGGFVTVESALGEGTTICVYLPQVSAALEPTDSLVSQAESQERRATGGSETILVCDDEKLALTTVAALLENLGYDLIVANTPLAALKIATNHDGPISLLLTDVTMPEMCGIELSKKMQRLFPAIKVVLTSGYAEDILQERLEENEQIEFIQKPASLGTLSRRIREVLDKKRAPTSEL